jgi:hypothetical protein
VIAAQKTALRGWEVMEEDNLALALMDLDTGELRIERLLIDGKEGEHPSGPPQRLPKPSASAANTVVTKVYHLDARERVKVPWRQGSVALAAIAFDWASNPVRVELTGGAPRPPVAPAAIAPLPAASAGALPLYEVTPRHPAMPDKGLAFTVESLATGSFVILGAYRKPTAPGDLIAAVQRLPTAAGQRTAIAAARMTLAVVGLDQRRPVIARWALPVFGTAPAVAGQPLMGHFAIDLRTTGFTGSPGLYVAYVFMDGAIYGPQRFSVP